MTLMKILLITCFDLSMFPLSQQRPVVLKHFYVLKQEGKTS